MPDTVATPDPAATPAPQPAPVPAPGATATPGPLFEQPKAPSTVALPLADFQRLVAAGQKLEAIEAEKAKAIEEERAAKLIAEAKAGNAEKAVAEFRQQAEAEKAALKAGILADKLSVVVASALAGKPFVSEVAARQAADLLSGRLEAVFDAAGKVVVRDRATQRAAADVIGEALGTADFAHFLKPSTKGGTDTRGATLTNPTPGPELPADFLAGRDLDRGMIARFAGHAAAVKAHGGGYQPVGLSAGAVGMYRGAPVAPAPTSLSSN